MVMLMGRGLGRDHVGVDHEEHMGESCGRKE
jgi:hypothetical protein